MQMKMALPLKKFTGFQHKGGGGRGMFGEALLELGEAAPQVLTPSSPGREVSRPACGSAWASPPSLLY